MANDVLLVMAKRGGRYIAGAINFIGSDTLYGRNWGCIEDHPFLHFEVCYHQAIDFAIEKKADGRRGRRARRAQAGARLPAGDDAVGAFHCPCRRCARRCPTISGASDREVERMKRISRRARPVPPGELQQAELQRISGPPSSTTD